MPRTDIHLVRITTSLWQNIVDDTQFFVQYTRGVSNLWHMYSVWPHQYDLLTPSPLRVAIAPARFLKHHKTFRPCIELIKTEISHDFLTKKIFKIYNYVQYSKVKIMKFLCLNLETFNLHHTQSAGNYTLLHIAAHMEECSCHKWINGSILWKVRRSGVREENMDAKKFSITSRNFLNMMRLSLVVSTYGGYPFFF